ncbi:uncharacterized protein LJ264_016329 [Porphyrio hochstetteri]
MCYLIGFEKHSAPKSDHVKEDGIGDPINQRSNKKIPPDNSAFSRSYIQASGGRGPAKLGYSDQKDRLKDISRECAQKAADMKSFSSLRKEADRGLRKESGRQRDLIGEDRSNVKSGSPPVGNGLRHCADQRIYGSQGRGPYKHDNAPHQAKLPLQVLGSNRPEAFPAGEKAVIRTRTDGVTGYDTDTSQDSRDKGSISSSRSRSKGWKPMRETLNVDSIFSETEKKQHSPKHKANAGAKSKHEKERSFNHWPNENQIQKGLMTIYEDETKQDTGSRSSLDSEGKGNAEKSKGFTERKIHGDNWQIQRTESGYESSDHISNGSANPDSPVIEGINQGDVKNVREIAACRKELAGCLSAPHLDGDQNLSTKKADSVLHSVSQQNRNFYGFEKHSAPKSDHVKEDGIGDPINQRSNKKIPPDNSAFSRSYIQASGGRGPAKLGYSDQKDRLKDISRECAQKAADMKSFSSLRKEADRGLRKESGRQRDLIGEDRSNVKSGSPPVGNGLRHCADQRIYGSQGRGPYKHDNTPHQAKLPLQVLGSNRPEAFPAGEKAVIRTRTDGVTGYDTDTSQDSRDKGSISSSRSRSKGWKPMRETLNVDSIFSETEKKQHSPKHKANAGAKSKHEKERSFNHWPNENQIQKGLMTIYEDETKQDTGSRSSLDSEGKGNAEKSKGFTERKIHGDNWQIQRTESGYESSDHISNGSANPDSPVIEGINQGDVKNVREIAACRKELAGCLSAPHLDGDQNLSTKKADSVLHSVPQQNRNFYGFEKHSAPKSDHVKEDGIGDPINQRSNKKIPPDNSAFSRSYIQASGGRGPAKLGYSDQKDRLKDISRECAQKAADMKSFSSLRKEADRGLRKESGRQRDLIGEDRSNVKSGSPPVGNGLRHCADQRIYGSQGRGPYKHDNTPHQAKLPLQVLGSNRPEAFPAGEKAVIRTRTDGVTGYDTDTSQDSRDKGSISSSRSRSKGWKPMRETLNVDSIFSETEKKQHSPKHKANAGAKSKHEKERSFNHWPNENQIQKGLMTIYEDETKQDTGSRSSLDSEGKGNAEKSKGFTERKIHGDNWQIQRTESGYESSDHISNGSANPDSPVIEGINQGDVKNVREIAACRRKELAGCLSAPHLDGDQNLSTKKADSVLHSVPQQNRNFYGFEKHSAPKSDHVKEDGIGDPINQRSNKKIPPDNSAFSRSYIQASGGRGPAKLGYSDQKDRLKDISRECAQKAADMKSFSSLRKEADRGLRKESGRQRDLIGEDRSNVKSGSPPVGNGLRHCADQRIYGSQGRGPYKHDNAPHQAKLPLQVLGSNRPEAFPAGEKAVIRTRTDGVTGYDTDTSQDSRDKGSISSSRSRSKGWKPMRETLNVDSIFSETEKKQHSPKHKANAGAKSKHEKERSFNHWPNENQIQKGLMTIYEDETKQDTGSRSSLDSEGKGNAEKSKGFTERKIHGDNWQIQRTESGYESSDHISNGSANPDSPVIEGINQGDVKNVREIAACRKELAGCLSAPHLDG